MYGYANPLRCARGAASLAVVNNVPTFALFNNSTGAHLLKVWRIATESGNATIRTSVLRGRLTNQGVGVVVPVLTDEGFPPGVIDSDDLPNNTTPDYAISQFAMDWPTPVCGTPLAVLRPGWSLVASCGPLGANNFCSFFWEWVYAEAFYRESAGDSADD